MSPANAASQFDAGAAEFRRLFATIVHISNATCDPDAEGDARDFEAIATAVVRSIRANITETEGAHAAGFAHALGYLLCCAADGCLPSEDATRA